MKSFFMRLKPFWLILGFEDVVESKLSLTSICFDYVLH